MFYLFLYIFIINFLVFLSIQKHNKIIISLTSDHENIQNTLVIINSILEQNVDRDLFKIILILSLNEYSNIKHLPKEIQLLENNNILSIMFVNEKVTNLRRTLITMKKFKHNPIIIINNKCLLPDGWLEMFINDHIKYPNDAIAATIQYYFGKNGTIFELSEGFKGEKFGTFNHVTEIIFNFALINIDLGGILFPNNFFKSNNFFQYDLFMKIANCCEDFWESAFIMLEDKTLRQSSKIFDYTKFLLIKYNYYNNNEILEQNKLSFIKEFPNFYETIIKRQTKIIVSITSYPKRFVFLTDLMHFIRNQTFHINKVIFFIYKDDLKYYKLDIKDVEIISTEKNLKPHLKYYYAMSMFRDYAIITLDDDTGYSKDTFGTLFNAYIEDPNVICGRRSHLMTFKNNGELKPYLKWVYEQKIINITDFNIVLTNVGGTIFPPDILNINQNILPIINETITCDDLTLKLFSNKKGIPPKWIVNKNVLGIPRKLPNNSDSPLSSVNIFNNDICINKMNIMINTTTLENLCVQYRNISTGNTIYLFNIHNKMIKKNITYFRMNAFSYCPIDLRIKFKIYFDNFSSECFFNQSNILKYVTSNNLKYSAIVSCSMNSIEDDLDNYVPFIITEEYIKIKIFNYRKYLTIIYKNFFCNENNSCILKVIQLENFNHNNLSMVFYNKSYLCKIKNTSTNSFPIINNFICKNSSNSHNNKTKIYISGIPLNSNINQEKFDNNIIPETFIIKRVITDLEKKEILIIGNSINNLKKELYNLTINIFSLKIELNCFLKPNSKYVQSIFHCFNEIGIKTEILIENQIAHSSINGEEELLLINEETLLKVNLNGKFIWNIKNKANYSL